MDGLQIEPVIDNEHVELTEQDSNQNVEESEQVEETPEPPIKKKREITPKQRKALELARKAKADRRAYLLKIGKEQTAILNSRKFKTKEEWEKANSVPKKSARKKREHHQEQVSAIDWSSMVAPLCLIGGAITAVYLTKSLTPSLNNTSYHQSHVSSPRKLSNRLLTNTDGSNTLGLGLL